MASWTRDLPVASTLDWNAADAATSPARRVPWLKSLAFGLLTSFAVLVVYFPFLRLPLISDDYLQIQLSRQFGNPAGWIALADDVLYRSRATSLVLSGLVDSVWGVDPFWHRMANLVLHAVNVLLVAGLGSWHRIGFRISVPAALVFLVAQNHQEAVVWTAALPELLVAAFVIAALLAWIRALDRRSVLWLATSGVLFLLSLLSKESGVVFLPLAAGIWILDRNGWKAPAVLLAAGAAIAAIYTAAILRAGDSHLHLGDGTFALQSGFLAVAAISIARLLFPWGFCAILALAWQRSGRWSTAACLCAMVVTLLPYSFLTYMNRVPSRHTYMATVALAVLLSMALAHFRQSRHPRHRVAIALVAASFVVFNTAYLWTKKVHQYERRAASTERFFQLANSGGGQRPIRIDCAPYPSSVYRLIVELRLGWPGQLVGSPAEMWPYREAESFCDRTMP